MLLCSHFLFSSSVRRVSSALVGIFEARSAILSSFENRARPLCSSNNSFATATPGSCLSSGSFRSSWYLTCYSTTDGSLLRPLGARHMLPFRPTVCPPQPFLLRRNDRLLGRHIHIPVSSSRPPVCPLHMQPRSVAMTDRFALCTVIPGGVYLTARLAHFACNLVPSP